MMILAKPVETLKPKHVDKSLLNYIELDLSICFLLFSIFVSSSRAQSVGAELESKLPFLASITHEDTARCMQTKSTANEMLSTDVESLWRWNYLEEFVPGFRVLVKDESLDARMANIIYTVNSGRAINVATRTIDLSDEDTNREYERLSAGSQVDDKLCGEQLSRMIALLDDLRNVTKSKQISNQKDQLQEQYIRLARVLDSYGRYSGLGLIGEFRFLGHHDLCTSSHLLLNPDKPAELTKTRYCTAQLDLKSNLDRSLSLRNKADIEMDTSIAVGLCLPASCHMVNSRLYMHLINQLLLSQFKLPQDLFVQTNPEVESIYCSPDADSELGLLPVSGRLFLVLLIVWFTLLMIATISRSLARGKHHNSSIPWLFKHVQESLDIRESLNDLATAGKRPMNSNVKMETFDCIKVLTCSLVVFGHTFIVNIAASTNILNAYKQLEQDPQVYAIILGSSVTDTFFVITGIVVTYSTLKKLDNSWKYVKEAKSLTLFKKMIYIILSRYLRLVPPYVFIYWLIKVFFSRLHSSEIWDDGLNIKTMVGACRQESWLTPFLGSATFKSLSRQCIAQAWSAASDMLFSFVLAPLIVLLHYKPPLALAMAVILSIYGTSSMYFATLNIDPVTSIALSDFKIHALVGQFQTLGLLYTDIRFRVASILIGGWAGYGLYHYAETGKIKAWPNWFTGAATKVSATAILTAQLLPCLLPLLREDNPDVQTSGYSMKVFASINAIGRLIWALSNAVILVRFVTDWKDGLLCQHFSSRFWTHLVKLNYCILLLHVHVQIFEVSISLAMRPFTRYSMHSLWLSSYFTCMLLAVPFYVLIENPILKLLRGFVDKIFLHERPRKSIEGDEDRKQS